MSQNSNAPDAHAVDPWSDPGILRGWLAEERAKNDDLRGDAVRLLLESRAAEAEVRGLRAENERLRTMSSQRPDAVAEMWGQHPEAHERRLAALAAAGITGSDARTSLNTFYERSPIEPDLFLRRLSRLFAALQLSQSDRAKALVHLYGADATRAATVLLSEARVES